MPLMTVSWDDVRRRALALPETTERSGDDRPPQWRVRDKLFVWERPLRQTDLQALGDEAPTGPILAARVADEGVKVALIADQPDVYFTTPHFDGYPAVLARLDAMSVGDLDELITDAWLARAPKRLVSRFLDESSGSA
jgi:hypothetical protein